MLFSETKHTELAFIYAGGHQHSKWYYNFYIETIIFWCLIIFCLTAFYSNVVLFQLWFIPYAHHLKAQAKPLSITAMPMGIECSFLHLFYFVGEGGKSGSFILRHINSISITSWQWYDVWDEKEKIPKPTLLPTQEIFNLPQYRHAMRGTGL